MSTQTNPAILRQQLYGNLDLKQNRQLITEICSYIDDQPIQAAAHVYHKNQLSHCIITPEQIHLFSVRNGSIKPCCTLPKSRIKRIQQALNGLAIHYPSSSPILLHWSLPRLPSKAFHQQLKTLPTQRINLIPPTNAQKTLFFAAPGLLILAPILPLVIPTPSPTPAASTPKAPAYNAEPACKQAVRAQLKAPTTAKIEIIRTGESSLRTSVFGQVTSQNSFGAMLTSPFSCEYRLTDGTANATIHE